MESTWYNASQMRNGQILTSQKNSYLIRVLFYGKLPYKKVVPDGGILDRLGNLNQDGHKICNLRHNEDNSRLLNYIEGVIYIYKATQLSQHRNTTNCWTRVSTNQHAEINGNICSVR